MCHYSTSNPTRTNTSSIPTNYTIMIDSGDWLLGYVYRATNAAMSIAGLAEVEHKHNRIQNIDLSEIVSANSIWWWLLTLI